MAKIKVQAQHLQPGDIVGSGEKVLSVHLGMHKKVDVRLNNPNRAVMELDPNRCDRVGSWGKYTMIGVERAEPYIGSDKHEHVDGVERNETK